MWLQSPSKALPRRHIRRHNCKPGTGLRLTGCTGLGSRTHLEILPPDSLLMASKVAAMRFLCAGLCPGSVSASSLASCSHLRTQQQHSNSQDGSAEPCISCGLQRLLNKTWSMAGGPPPVNPSRPPEPHHRFVQHITLGLQPSSLDARSSLSPGQPTTQKVWIMRTQASLGFAGQVLTSQCVLSCGQAPAHHSHVAAAAPAHWSGPTSPHQRQ